MKPIFFVSKIDVQNDGMLLDDANKSLRLFDGDRRRRLGKTSDTSSETSRKEDPTQEDIQCDDTIEQKSNITAKMLAVMTTSQTKCNRDSCCRNIIDEPNYDSTMAHCYTNCEPIESLVTSF